MEDAIPHVCQCVRLSPVLLLALLLLACRALLPKGAGWIHEIKHDGFRMIVRRPAVHEKRIRLDRPVSAHLTSGTCSAGQRISA
jgi:hypothetical protein